MSQENLRQLSSQLRAAQERHVYFLLAAAASAIAFALVRTEGRALALQMLPLGGAVLAWGASFASGCRLVAYLNSALYANADLVKVEDGIHPLARSLHERQVASEVIREAIDRKGERSEALGRAQFTFLVVGACLYIAWQVWDMLARA